MFAPLTTVPNVTPSYLALEPSSAWHTSALQMTALETITLPCRLRNATSGYSLMVDMEQLFTLDSSRRNILQSSITVKSNRQQINGVTNGNTNETERETNGLNGITDEPALDIDLFEQAPVSSRGQVHTFGQSQIDRGGREPISSDRLTRMEVDGGSTSRQYTSQLAFPCLSSFPSIFGNTSEGDKLEIKASLAATTAVSKKLRRYAEQARILPSDEREDMSSDFRTWADEYVDGWESDEDDWDD